MIPGENTAPFDRFRGGCAPLHQTEMLISAQGRPHLSLHVRRARSHRPRVEQNSSGSQSWPPFTQIRVWFTRQAKGCLSQHTSLMITMMVAAGTHDTLPTLTLVLKAKSSDVCLRFLLESGMVRWNKTLHSAINHE